MRAARYQKTDVDNIHWISNTRRNVPSSATAASVVNGKKIHMCLQLVRVPNLYFGSRLGVQYPKYTIVYNTVGEPDYEIGNARQRMNCV